MDRSDQPATPEPLAHDPLAQRPEWDAGLPLFSNICPLCGGILKPGRVRCLICRGEQRATLRAAVAKTAPADGLQFSIETLLLMTTLAALCLGAFAMEPVSGSCLSAVVLVALARTLIVGRQRLAVGLPFPLGEKVTEYLVSLFVVVCTIGVGFLTLMVVMCMGVLATVFAAEFRLPRPPNSQGLYFVLTILFWLSAIVGPITAGLWLLWTTRPRG
jgi:hypothetical protein